MSEFTRCDLTLMCRKTWGKLHETASPHVRYCDNCDKRVFSVRTRAQLELASALGRCVALTDDNKIVRWIGKTNVDSMAEESETVAVRTLQALDAETESRLRMAYPKLLSAETEFPPGAWIIFGTFSLQVAVNLEKDIHAQFPELEIRERME